MLTAYSVFKDLDKRAYEILINSGIELELSICEERPNIETQGFVRTGCRIFKFR